jgi:hypothetical protein
MFYFVMVNARSGVTIEDVQRVLLVNPVTNYYRIAPNVWIAKVADWPYANHATTISARLQPLVEPTGRHLVVQMNVADREGWMDKEFWTWLRNNS